MSSTKIDVHQCVWFNHFQYKKKILFSKACKYVPKVRFQNKYIFGK